MNPYQLLDPDMIDAGQEALDSGLISPQEAMSNLSPILKHLGLKQNLFSGAPKQIALTPAQKKLKEMRTMEQAPGFVGPPREQTPDDAVLNQATETPGVFEALGVKPVAKGSNEAFKLRFDNTEEEKSSTKGGSSSSETTPTAMSPEEFAKANANIESLPDIKDQRQGIANLQSWI